MGNTTGKRITAKIVQTKPIVQIKKILIPARINNNNIPAQNKTTDAITIAHTVAVITTAPANNQCQPKMIPSRIKAAIAKKVVIQCSSLIKSDFLYHAKV